LQKVKRSFEVDL